MSRVALVLQHFIQHAAIDVLQVSLNNVLLLTIEWKTIWVERKMSEQKLYMDNKIIIISGTNKITIGYYARRSPWIRICTNNNATIWYL